MPYINYNIIYMVAILERSILQRILERTFQSCNTRTQGQKVAILECRVAILECMVAILERIK